MPPPKFTTSEYNTSEYNYCVKHFGIYTRMASAFFSSKPDTPRKVSQSFRCTSRSRETFVPGSRRKGSKTLYWFYHRMQFERLCFVFGFNVVFTEIFDIFVRTARYRLDRKDFIPCFSVHEGKNMYKPPDVSILDFGRKQNTRWEIPLKKKKYKQILCLR